MTEPLSPSPAGQRSVNGQTTVQHAWRGQAIAKSTPQHDADPTAFLQRRKRIRTYCIIGIVVAAVASLVIAGAIKSDSDAADKHAITFTTPQRIGPLVRSADQSNIDSLRSDLSNMGADDSFAIVYDDTAIPRGTVDVWGVSSWQYEAVTEQRFIDELFAQPNQLYGAQAYGPRITVPAGGVGGTAQCASIDSFSGPATMCVWARSVTYIQLNFIGRTPADCKQLLGQLLAAITAR